MSGGLARGGGAVVMGTGIVSVALSIDEHEVLSRILLVAAAAGLAVLAVALIALVLRDRGRLLDAACVPGALTWVAATDVVGARLSSLGWQREAVALLIAAVALWLILVPLVLAHWQRPTVGLSFLLVVATESVAVLAARLSLDTDARWLADAALACFALGLAFYLLVVAGFDRRELLVGAGDHWIAGGALAIATLACARCAQAIAGDTLQTVALALWATAAAWLPALLITELLRGRLGYDERRWSTVFPLGMYAVCSFAVGKVAGIGGLVDFARIWVWVALAVWLLVAAATVRRAI